MKPVIITQTKLALNWALFAAVETSFSALLTFGSLISCVTEEDA